MKILIIGSSGFLGSELYRTLSSHKKNIDLLNRKKIENINNKQYSFEEFNNIKNIYDIVFFLSAYIPGQNKPVEDVQLNVNLATRIADKFYKSRIVYSSSVSVYGKPQGEIITESYSLSPLSDYGNSKLLGERTISECPDYRILRFSSLYGKNMTSNTFVKSILEKANQKEELNLYDQYRKQDYLYIKDAATMLMLASEHDKNCILNGVYGKSITNKEVIETINSFYKLKINTHIDNTEKIINSFEYSSDKFDSIFKYKKHTFKKGISLTIK